MTEDLRAEVVEEFTRTGSINRAAITSGLSHDAARRILVGEGIVPSKRLGVGKRQAKARFLELIEQGWSSTRASREVGVHPRTGRDWRRGVRKTGNTRVYPDGTVVDSVTGTRYVKSMTPSADAVISKRYLSLDDRLAIADGLVNKQTLTAIAAGIGKHVSSIAREVRRHSIEGLYLPHQAHRDAAAARSRPKAAKLVTNQRLRAAVEEGLERKLSPEQISHRLIVDHPDDESMRVSHETIYQSLFVQGRGELRRELVRCLRSGRTARRTRGTTDGRGRIPGMVLLAERPAEVDDRSVPGHWEGDLITGSANRSAVGTLVERSTRYVMLLHLPGSHTAEAVREAMTAKIQTLPAHLVRSITWDQGTEMAQHARFTIDTGVAVYFCDPHSPWQRGSNENTNGLLRQYLPKGTDLSNVSREQLDAIQDSLNRRPRKTLGYLTPSEKFAELLAPTP